MTNKETRAENKQIKDCYIELAKGFDEMMKKARTKYGVRIACIAYLNFLKALVDNK